MSTEQAIATDALLIRITYFAEVPAPPSGPWP